MESHMKLQNIEPVMSRVGPCVFILLEDGDSELAWPPQGMYNYKI